MRGHRGPRNEEKVRSMADGVHREEPTTAQSRPTRRLWRVLLWLGAALVVLLVAFFAAGDIVLHHAGPLLNEKVVETLSARFDSRVELARFDVSFVKGFEVSGSGLKLYPNHLQMDEPLIEADRFSFHVLNWHQLLRTPLYVNKVQVNGLSIHLPPKSQRANLPHLEKSGSGAGGNHSGIKVVVGEILVDHADLVIENGKPNKVPLDFEIDQLQLRSVGDGRPLQFHAILVNPKPVGDIDSSGDFGPFDAESPGDTPIDGTYAFSHADLSTLKGIGGMLSSTGSYSGQLDRITVDGETTTPDFRLDTAEHSLPLDTKFHAVVDGTSGDTQLEPVDAWLARTHIVAKGAVVRAVNQRGHNIHLDVTVGPGRIEDLLQLAIRTDPPLMNGQVQMNASFDLPPGNASVTDKLHLDGSFAVMDAHFSNQKFQHEVDQLSLRGQGKAQEAKQEEAAMKLGNTDGGTHANVGSDMRGDFILGDGKLTISALNYTVPGADVALNGVYTLDGQVFDFRGDARLDAHISQMVTGWKSLLLKPVDPFFAKHGAGTQVPIKITGTKSSPQIGLNY